MVISRRGPDVDAEKEGRMIVRWAVAGEDAGGKAPVLRGFHFDEPREEAVVHNYPPSLS